MSSMQVFRSQLESNGGVSTPYFQALARISQASLDQLKVLEGAPSWDPWYADGA